MSDAPQPPARVPSAPVARQLELDRAGLERVLARAAELQATISDNTELLSESQLLEIGKEVGLSPHHLRQAIAEERARLGDSEARDAISRMFGPGQVHARRTLTGDPARILEAIDALMQKEQSLQVKRRFPDRMLWESKRGFMSEMQRTMDVSGRGYHLCKANEVSASVVPVDDQRVLVHLSADVRPARSNRLIAGTVAGGTGAATSAVLLILGVFVPVALGAALIGAGSGYLVARTYGPLAERVHLALEQVLDRVERGDRPRRGLLADLKSGIVLRDG